MSNLDQMLGAEEPYRFSFSELARAAIPDPSDVVPAYHFDPGDGAFLNRRYIAVFETENLRSRKAFTVRSLVKRGNLLQEMAHPEVVKEFYARRHINLQNVVGYCTTKTRLLVVSEWMPYTLTSLFYGPGCPDPRLDWKARLGIAIDVATALHFLHNSDPSEPYGSLSTETVLVSDHLRVKLSDLRRSGMQVEWLPEPDPIMGFIKPENIFDDPSREVDVYSFGVLLMVLITGQKSYYPDKVGKRFKMFDVSLLPQKVAELIQDDTSLDCLRDPSLKGTDVNFDSVMKLAVRCINENGRLRITEVCRELKLYYLSLQ